MTLCNHSSSFISTAPSVSRNRYRPPHKRQANNASLISEKPLFRGSPFLKSHTDISSPPCPRQQEDNRKHERICLPAPSEEENLRIDEAVKKKRSKANCVPERTNKGLKNDALLHGSCSTICKIDDHWLMEESSYFEDNVVPILWGCKDVLAEVFSTHEGAQNYNAVRNAIFPKDVRFSMSYKSENRAHDILEEIFTIVEKETNVFLPKALITEDGKNARFLDICGAPGGWSACIFRIVERLTYNMTSVAGFGVSLAHKADRWKSKLISNPAWTALYGPNGNGDVRDSRTIEAVAEHIFNDCIQKKTHAVKLAVADGSISMVHLNENLQELYTASIIIGELRLIMAALVTGGHCVIKLFDTFSDFTVASPAYQLLRFPSLVTLLPCALYQASIIFVCCQIFADVLIVKPTRSRVSNSERFLVGVSLKTKSSCMFQSLRKAVNNAAALCVNHYIPNSIVPIELMREDLVFMKTMKKVVQLHCERQIASLNVINFTYQKLYGPLETEPVIRSDAASNARTDAFRNLESEICDSPTESIYFDSDIESLDGMESDTFLFSKMGKCNYEDLSDDGVSVHSEATVSTPSLTTEVGTPVASSNYLLATLDTPIISDSVMPCFTEQQLAEVSKKSGITSTVMGSKTT